MNEYWKNQKRVPRGNPNGGRWTSDLDRIYNNAYESDRKPLPVSLDFFSKKTKISSENNYVDTPPVPQKAYGFASKERLHTKHHVRHAEDMGYYKNQRQYEKDSIDFWETKSGKIYYSSVRDRFYKYDKSKYVVVGVDGTVHTFMLCSLKKFISIIRLEKLREISTDW